MYDYQGLTPLPSEAPWYLKWLAANAPYVWRRFSFWFASIQATIAAFLVFPGAADWLEQSVPKTWVHGIQLFIGGATILSMFIAQRKKGQSVAETMANTGPKQ